MRESHDLTRAQKVHQDTIHHCHHLLQRHRHLAITHCTQRRVRLRTGFWYSGTIGTAVRHWRRGAYIPPPPPWTPSQSAMVRNNENYNRENLIGPFLVHKLLGPRLPPSLSSITCLLVLAVVHFALHVQRCPQNVVFIAPGAFVRCLWMIPSPRGDGFRSSNECPHARNGGRGLWRVDHPATPHRGSCTPDHTPPHTHHGLRFTVHVTLWGWLKVHGVCAGTEVDAT